MKKLMVKFLAACLVISLLPVSAIAEYTIPDYAVTLNASAPRIYEGETVDISFNINSEDFLMTDMSVGYESEYFTYEDDTTGVVEFDTPEIKGTDGTDGNGSYDLATKFTFTAKEVDDTEEVNFDIVAADIVYSYESAREDAPTNVANTTGTSVIIVKQYDVTFEENGVVLDTQTIDKGLNDEADTALTVPEVSYNEYVGEGLNAAYYEHVWKYNGNEYTDEEIAAFGQVGSENEITEDTIFVLEVREQQFNVTVPAEDFDTEVTLDNATYGTDYTGKINSDVYYDKYDYTVKYEIDGITQEVPCDGDSFTIPGENIIGDMTLSYEKELNIVIKAYADYVPGYFLITVEGAALGYTFDGHEMYKSETHGGLRAWLYEGVMTESEAAATVEGLIFTSTTESPVAPAGYDINESGATDISDATLAYGAYTVSLNPMNEWIKEYLSADVDVSYKVNTLDFNKVVDEYKGRN